MLIFLFFVKIYNCGVFRLCINLKNNKIPFMQYIAKSKTLYSKWYLSRDNSWDIVSNILKFKMMYMYI